jgi:hypothetical protein
LTDGTHESVEELAEANGIHPKVVLSPEITSGSHRKQATLDAHASPDTEAAASSKVKTKPAAGAEYLNKPLIIQPRHSRIACGQMSAVHSAADHDRSTANVGFVP